MYLFSHPRRSLPARSGWTAALTGSCPDCSRLLLCRTWQSTWTDARQAADVTESRLSDAKPHQRRPAVLLGSTCEPCACRADRCTLRQRAVIWERPLEFEVTSAGQRPQASAANRSRHRPRGAGVRCARWGHSKGPRIRLSTRSRICRHGPAAHERSADAGASRRCRPRRRQTGAQAARVHPFGAGHGLAHPALPGASGGSLGFRAAEPAAQRLSSLLHDR